MLKVLLLEDDPSLLDRIAFVLESVPGIEVLRASNRNEAVSIAKSSRDITLIVLDSHKTPLNAFYELQRVTPEAECIVCVDSLKNPPPPLGWKTLAVIERVHSPRLLHLHVDQWVREKNTVVADESPNDYVRIKTQLLIDISPLLSDIYARLSERKYLKIFQEGDVFDANDLARYAEQKKIEYMYLRVDKCHEFINKYIAFIEKYIRDAKIISVEEISMMHGAIHESVQELTDKLGFTRDVQSLAKSQVQLTVQTMGKKPSMKSIMKLLESRRGHYATDHCFIVGYIACAIASHLEWGSEMTFHKLTLAAFMHDISLTDERMVDVETLGEMKNRGFSDAEIEVFKKHPTRVAEMVRQMSEIPPDVDSIVAQHHEMPDGSGFPRGISSRYMSPLAMIFMVAHFMTKELMRNPDDFNLSHCLEKLNARFNQTPFKKVLTAAAALNL